MPDKPILFSGPMVRALLDGRKTQTRRVIVPRQDGAYRIYSHGKVIGSAFNPDYEFRKGSGCQFTKHAIGDRLWVREAHYLTDDGESEYAVFAADEADVAEHLQNMQTTMSSHPHIDWSKHLRLRPSIHMPRWASRLTLVVTDVRVHRVQDISSDDARAEGVIRTGEFYWTSGEGMGAPTARAAFCKLWDSLNAERGFGWAANPCVTAYTFTVHKCNIDQMESKDD